MPSPFPGMNPYFEQEDAWDDFRKRFIARLADGLVEQVRAGYIVRIVESVPADDGGSSCINVFKRQGRELVTVVELLSPSNKRPGADRDQYLAKRAALLGGPVHLVEIDLLRGGKPLPLADRPESDYAVMVSRVEDRPGADFWPIGLRDRLPIIPVPLRSPDPEARVDLQDLLQRIYDTAGYRYYIYTGLPDPPLGPDDRAWADGLVPQLA